MEEKTIGVHSLLSQPTGGEKTKITQEKRDTLLHFNTPRYWHCFYDSETGRLYDEYGYMKMENATDYLIECGLLDKNKNVLGYFLNDNGTVR